MYKIRIINNAVSEALKASPLKDLTSSNESSFVMGRNIYRETQDNNKNIHPNKKFYGMKNSDASDVMRRRSNESVGAGSLNAAQIPFSYVSSNNTQTQNQALQRVRNKGYTPKI